MEKGKRIGLFVVFFFIVFTVIVFAVPGDFDPFFGTGGVVTYNSPANNNDWSWAIAIQKDGKMVVVGETFNGANLDILVLRYNIDGALDDTFGTGGVVTYNSPADRDDWAFGVAIQKDGKIVVPCYVHNGANWDVQVLRYNIDGVLDDTFGTGGVVIYDSPSNRNDAGEWLALQRDGKIVVVGYVHNGTDFDVLVLRYNVDGTLDNTFGTGGVVTYRSPANGHDWGYEIALQNDGKIVVVGKSDNGVNDDILLLRYTRNGVLDNTFGTGGVVTYNSPANQDDEGRGVALQRDGKIVVVGDSFNGANWNVLILRYTRKGILDSTFGTGGVATYNDPAAGDDSGQAVVIQKDGKIVGAGKSFNGNDDVLVFRLLGK